MSLAAFGASQYNHFATPSSSDPTNLRDTNAEPGDPSSPSNPFANLDPQLHPEILNNETEGNNSPPVENRLNDFAQHVLEVHDDAAHILDFTAGEEEVLFGANQAHQSFGGLLEATGQTLSDEEDRKHDEYGGEGVDGSSGHDGADDTPGGRLRSGGRKRRREADDGENGATMDPIKVKKDSHKEVERRRRENINDGIGEIARLVPGGLEKMGKGTLLRRAAEHLVELTDKVTRFDTELAKRETEKAEAQNELVHVQHRLAEEHSRSIRYETSWREAEDRAASSQFELERVRGELEELRK